MERRIDGNDVKRRNREAAFRVIQRESPISRADIAGRTHVSLATAATLVDEMLDAGIAVESKDDRGTIGRKPKLVTLIPDARLAVAFDLASSHELSYVAIGLDGKPKIEHSEPRDSGRGYEQQLRDFLASAKASIRQEGLEARVIGFGASVPGPYNQSMDRVICKRVRDITTVPVRRLLEDVFGARPLIDEDVKLAADASIRMLPDGGGSDALYVYLGEGVGGAFSLHEGIHAGAGGFAGDIGQMRLSANECIEDCVSWSAFSRGFDGPSYGERIDQAAAALAQRARDNDRAVNARLEKTAAILAIALSNAAWLLNPGIILIDGYARVFGDAFLDLLRHDMESWLMPGMAPRLGFAPVEAGAKSSLLGAAVRIQKAWIDSL